MAPGASNNFGAPIFEPKVFCEPMYCIEKSTWNNVRTFRRPSVILRHDIVTPCPPSVRTWCQLPWKKMPRDNWTKAERYSVRFSSWPKHYRPNLHFPENFIEILVVCQRCLPTFVDVETVYDRVHREKLCGVLREYDVGGRLLLAVKSLNSCSDVCVCVGGVKSQPFTVGVWLWQEFMLSPMGTIRWGTRGTRPPTFSDSGDIQKYAMSPTFFSLGFVIYCFHTKLSPSHFATKLRLCCHHSPSWSMWIV